MVWDEASPCHNKRNDCVWVWHVKNDCQILGVCAWSIWRETRHVLIVIICWKTLKNSVALRLASYRHTIRASSSRERVLLAVRFGLHRTAIRYPIAGGKREVKSVFLPIGWLSDIYKLSHISRISDGIKMFFEYAKHERVFVNKITIISYSGILLADSCSRTKLVTP